MPTRTLPRSLLWTKAKVYDGNDDLLWERVRVVLREDKLTLIERGGGTLLDAADVVSGTRDRTKELRVVVDDGTGPRAFWIKRDCGCRG